MYCNFYFYSEYSYFVVNVNFIENFQFVFGLIRWISIRFHYTNFADCVTLSDRTKSTARSKCRCSNLIENDLFDCIVDSVCTYTMGLKSAFIKYGNVTETMWHNLSLSRNFVQMQMRQTNVMTNFDHEFYILSNISHLIFPHLRCSHFQNKSFFQFSFFILISISKSAVWKRNKKKFSSRNYWSFSQIRIMAWVRICFGCLTGKFVVANMTIE